jgi:DNA-binding NtrC family response regulator
MHAKVLVVDDDVSMRTSIGLLLERHGFDVTLAPNVPEALEVLKAERFDVLLTDLQMPGPGDGMTVIQAARESKPSPVTLLMSGQPHPDAEMIALATDEILRKPFPMGSLVDLIHRKLRTERVQPARLT